MAVFLGKEGLIKRKPLAIPLSRITVAGVDCWLASEDTEPLDAREIDEGQHYTLASELKGRELQTSGGTRIGTIGDVVLDDGFRVTAFALGKVHVEGPIAEAKEVPRESVADLGDGKTPAVMDLELAEHR
jgi:sporulation protein YlmC with PRC-barrel domain